VQALASASIILLLLFTSRSVACSTNRPSIKSSASFAKMADLPILGNSVLGDSLMLGVGDLLDIWYCRYL
jgi:hypothetical protein